MILATDIALLALCVCVGLLAVEGERRYRQWVGRIVSRMLGEE